MQRRPCCTIPPGNREAGIPIAGMPMRVLGDRVSRQTAWRIAAGLGLDDPSPAEYLAVTTLQADALVALDPWLAATDVVPTAPFDALLRRPS